MPKIKISEVHMPQGMCCYGDIGYKARSQVHKGTGHKGTVYGYGALKVRERTALQLNTEGTESPNILMSAPQKISSPFLLFQTFTKDPAVTFYHCQASHGREQNHVLLLDTGELTTSSKEKQSLLLSNSRTARF